jgi:hypothetical protein
MAVMYFFTVSDPRGAGSFPPSVMCSDWYNNFLNYAGFYSIGANNSYIWSFVFKNEAQFKDWVESYSLTDSTLLEDIEKWSIDQKVDYDHKVVNLPELTVKGLF